MKPKIVIASSNYGKITEFKQIFKCNYEILSMQDIGFFDEIEETGTTFLENAIIKAKSVYNYCKSAVIADDSGLCVRALNGEPGVFSARYISHSDSDANIMAVLDKMKNIADRRAKFVCAVCYIDDSGEIITTLGECDGLITHSKKGNNGFGYDSIFYSEDLNKTFGESNILEKQQCCHRSRALIKLFQIINSFKV